jgi:O-antigen/teichoic acid export membrane protein
MLRLAVRNYLFSSCGTLITAFVSILVGGLTIRFLGDQRAGYLMMLQAILGTTANLAGLGFGAAGIRRVSVLSKEYRLPELRIVVGIVLVISIAIGVIGIAVLLLGFPKIFEWSRIDGAFNQDAFLATMLIGATFFIQQVTGVYTMLFAGFQRYDIIASLKAGQRVISAGLSLIVLMSFPSMMSLSLVLLFIESGRLLLSTRIARQLVQGAIRPAWDCSEARTMLTFGGWAYLNSVASILMQSADKLLLTSIGGSALLPYYALGQNVVQQAHGALVSQSEFVFPMLAGSQEKTEYLSSIEDRLRWFTALSSAVLYGVLATTAYPLLSRLIGAAFAVRALPLYLIACVQGFFLAQTIVPFYIGWAEGQAKPNAIVMSLNGLLVATSIAVMAPHLGALGASLGQLWVAPMALVLAAWVMIKGRRFNLQRLMRPMITPAASLLVWGMVTWLSWHSRGDGVVKFLLISGVGGGSAILASVLLEYVMFPGFNCVQTTLSAVRVVIGRIANPSQSPGPG